jgi:protein-arginine kinase
MNSVGEKLFQDSKLAKKTIAVRVSHRIRLTHNLADFQLVNNTVHRRPQAWRLYVNNTVRNICDGLDSDKLFLVEGHLHSDEFIMETYEFKLLFEDDHLTSIRRNEEDHL